jgi:hypothetical protein
MDVAQMTDLLGALQATIQAYNVTVLVTNHHRKGNGLDTPPLEDLHTHKPRVWAVDPMENCN